MRTRLCLATAVALLLLASCGDAVDEAAVLPETGGRSASELPRSELAPPAETNAADRSDGPWIQTGQRSGSYDLKLEGVRVVRHESGDRIVLTFAGDGKLGWAARTPPVLRRTLWVPMGVATLMGTSTIGVVSVVVTRR